MSATASPVWYAPRASVHRTTADVLHISVIGLHVVYDRPGCTVTNAAPAVRSNYSSVI